LILNLYRIKIVNPYPCMLLADCSFDWLTMGLFYLWHHIGEAHGIIHEWQGFIPYCCGVYYRGNVLVQFIKLCTAHSIVISIIKKFIRLPFLNVDTDHVKYADHSANSSGIPTGWSCHSFLQSKGTQSLFKFEIILI